MLETIGTYPINEGLSGYWDILSPEDIAEFDKAMDIALFLIEDSSRIESELRQSVSSFGANLAKSAEFNQKSFYMPILKSHMPPREALETPRTESYDSHREERLRGITIASGPHTPEPTKPENNSSYLVQK